MPSKRKSKKTHVFQISTRSTRSKAKNLVKAEEDDDEVDEPCPIQEESIDEPEQESSKTKQIDKSNIDEQVENDEEFEEETETKDTETFTKQQRKTDHQRRLSRRSHHYKSYSHEMLVAAYKCVKDRKMPVKAAARMFGVPSSTLHNRVQGQVSIDDSIISKEDLNTILDKLENGQRLEDAFADFNYERSKEFMTTEVETIEDNSNDDSITESILQKMKEGVQQIDGIIKEEVVLPEYEVENGFSSFDTSNCSDSNSSQTSQEQLKRSYKRNYKTYSYEQLVAAYLYVKEKKVAVKFAARAFGVPPSTLNDRVQGKVFIDTSIVTNNPKGRKNLPLPALGKTSKSFDKSGTSACSVRKTFTLTLNKKAELIAEVDKGGKTRTRIAEDYGIAPSTLSGIMVNRQKIMEAFYSNSQSSNRKKFRKSTFHDLERELLKWVSICQCKNIPFNGPKLIEKAKDLAQELDVPDFTGSTGWIDRFKTRNNIKFSPAIEMKKVSNEERKITTLTLEKKVELLEKVDKCEKSKRQLAFDYGIAPSTLSGIIVNRERIMEAFNSKSFGPDRKKFRRSTFQDVEEDLVKFVEESKDKNLVIKSASLLEKAKDIAKDRGIENFSGSHSWIERFKTRNTRSFNDTSDDEEKCTPEASGHESSQSDNTGSNDSAPTTPEVTNDFSKISQVPRQQAFDSVEHSPEFQNLFKKHKCRDQYRKYTQEQLMEACKYSLENKASYREVSEKFGIPQSTLRDKLHAVERLNTEPGQPPLAKKSKVETPEPTVTEIVVSPEPPIDQEKVTDKTNYRQYSKESLITAAHYVLKFNTPIMKAARMFGVPASTLKDNVKNKTNFYDMYDVPDRSSPSIPSLISEKDEKKLIEYIKAMEKCGFVLTKKEIIEFGSELASMSQEIEGSITLSDSWYIDFVKRWPPIGLANRENRNVVPHDIKKYFTELNKVFNKHKFFERPELVYVLDEVDISLQYNPLKLAAGKKLSRCSKPVHAPLTSVVGCCNALGTSLPPYYVLHSDEILTDILSQSPPGTQASFFNTKSKDGSVLRDYFQNHFIRFAQSGRNTQNRFVLVFYDSRKTNLNVSDIEWAKRWHILLFPLPHEISKEPAVSVETIIGIFETYSAVIEEERNRFVNDKGFMAVAMPDICGILGRAYRKSLTYNHIVSCFENWGIYPLNPQKYVLQLEVPFQMKLQDLRATPSYETNLWLLSDFSCTQAINNVIESSFNESNNTRDENSIVHAILKRQASLGESDSRNNSVSTTGDNDAAFNASYQGMINHLMSQTTMNSPQQDQQIVNGVAIKLEPAADASYGAMETEFSPKIVYTSNNSQHVNGYEISQESQNMHKNQVVPEMHIVRTSSLTHPSSDMHNEENTSQSLAKNKCESSSSSRRKGKSHRIIVNESDPVEDIKETSTVESNPVVTKSKSDTGRRTSKLDSLLDEKVRKLHEKAKACGENDQSEQETGRGDLGNDQDEDEPIMKVGEFQIVMNKGE